MFNKVLITAVFVIAKNLSPSCAMEIKTDTSPHSLQETIETQSPEKKRLVHNLWVIEQVTLHLFEGQFPKDIRNIISGYELLSREPIYAKCLSPKNLEDLMVNMVWNSGFNGHFIGEMNIVKEGFEFGEVYCYPFEGLVRKNNEIIKLRKIRVQTGSGTLITYTFQSDYGTYTFFSTPLDDLGNRLNMADFIFETIKTEKAKGQLRSLNTSNPNLNLKEYIDSDLPGSVDINTEDLIIKIVKKNRLKRGA